MNFFSGIFGNTGIFGNLGLSGNRSLDELESRQGKKEEKSNPAPLSDKGNLSNNNSNNNSSHSSSIIKKDESSQSSINRDEADGAILIEKVVNVLKQTLSEIPNVHVTSGSNDWLDIKVTFRDPQTRDAAVSALARALSIYDLKGNVSKLAKNVVHIRPLHGNWVDAAKNLPSPAFASSFRIRYEALSQASAQQYTLPQGLLNSDVPLDVKVNVLDRMQNAQKVEEISNSLLACVDRALEEEIGNKPGMYGDYLAEAIEKYNLSSPLSMEFLLREPHSHTNNTTRYYYESGELERCTCDPMTRGAMGTIQPVKNLREKLIGFRRFLIEQLKSQCDEEQFKKNIDEYLDRMQKGQAVEKWASKQVSTNSNSNEDKLLENEFAKFRAACYSQSPNNNATEIEAEIALIDPDFLLELNGSSAINGTEVPNFVHTALRVGNCVIRQSVDKKVIIENFTFMKLLDKNMVTKSVGKLDDDKLYLLFKAMLNFNSAEFAESHSEAFTGKAVEQLEIRLENELKTLERVFQGKRLKGFFDSEGNKVEFHTHNELGIYANSIRPTMENSHPFGWALLKAISRQFYWSFYRHGVNAENKPALYQPFTDPKKTNSFPGDFFQIDKK